MSTQCIYNPNMTTSEASPSPHIYKRETDNIYYFQPRHISALQRILHINILTIPHSQLDFNLPDNFEVVTEFQMQEIVVGLYRIHQVDYLSRRVCYKTPNVPGYKDIEKIIIKDYEPDSTVRNVRCNRCWNLIPKDRVSYFDMYDDYQ